MFYAISYEIRDYRRRLQVAKLLLNFGERVQYSVFEANLGPAEFARLNAGLSELIDPEEDCVRLYPLCAGCVSRIRIMRPGSVTEDPETIIIKRNLMNRCSREDVMANCHMAEFISDIRVNDAFGAVFCEC